MSLPQLVHGGGVVVGQRPPTRTLTKTMFHTERSLFTTEWDVFEIMDLTVEDHHHPQVPIIERPEEMVEIDRHFRTRR
ncbi:MAG: hypothetical protein OXG24_07410 [Gammaproteobacteria bacterium]|nr:hypothetical protein [Gammaproteobacteria bacterium]